MNNWTKLDCISVKIVSIVILFAAILFTPFQYYICGLTFSLINLSAFVFVSSVLFLFGFMSLLKTNNPATRFNPFTLNPNYKSEMKYTMNESPGQIFELDSPDENEVKRRNREKKINQLLK